MKPPVVVQARDGKWVFGTPEQEDELRARAKGEFDSAADATKAAIERSVA